MGDYADDAIDSSMHEWMNEKEAPDEFQDPIDGQVIKVKYHKRHCKYCGEDNLHWVRGKEGKFALKNERDEFHFCSEYHNQRKPV